FTVMLIADLAMITGNIGRPGVGVNPLRGQNNVQGAADMGVQPHQGAGYLDITNPEIRRNYEQFYGVDLPTEVGLKSTHMLDAAEEGKLKALWIMGEDIAQTDPNVQKVRRSLDKLDLLVVQELFETETTKHAHVILPGASFLEKNGTFTNGERRVQRVNQVIDPLPGTKADGQIIVEMMNKLGYKQPDYHPKTMLEEISQIVPFFKGIKWEELGKNGKQWPVQENGQDTKILHQETFKLGKGRFYYFDFAESKEIEENGEVYPFIMTTVRNLEHYNCGTMTRRTDNVAINSEDIILINPNDAMHKAIADGDKVQVSSARGTVQMKAAVSSAVKPGILSTTFHFPEIMINNLTSDVLDSEAACPEYKVVAVDVEKIEWQD
ncbi:molybdopterin-dependent oxidoreductase, partial [candidate division KSB1 bacterium]|nr:molybdopterin-dependent oxidoreductase [candidate division KSB1 bacterium]